jgi:hypothetical protein
MAESRRDRLRRYARGDWTKRELETLVGLLIFDQAIDTATGGRLSNLKLSALKKIVIPAVSTSGRIAGNIALGAGRVLGSSAIGAAAPIVTNPYIAGTALGLGALQTQPGQDLLEAAGERGRMDRIRFEQALTDIEVGAGKAVKKTKSKFNRAVSAGMKAAKNSASYGKKGVINAPKKVFTTVTKIASKINENKKRGKLLPKAPKAKGPKALYNAIKKVLL